MASAIFVIFAFVFLFGAVAMARGQEDAAGSVGGRVVDVAAGEHLERLITLGDRLRFGEEVVVQSEPILSGQAKALNQQKNALNIKNIVAADQIGRFPDRNASEAISRLPGVVLERDQGEGRFVKIRGAASRLNSSSVNGVRLPGRHPGRAHPRHRRLHETRAGVRKAGG